MDSAFLTLFVPAGVILVVNILLFLRICCLLRLPSVSRQGSLSRCDDPDTDETHDNNEIEVLAPRGRPRGQTRSTHSDSMSSDLASSILDPAYKPSRQLLTCISLLVLLTLTWISAACTVSSPLTFAHSEVVYQSLYATTAAILGLFIVVYYCIGRPEVRALSCSCCCRRHRRRQKVVSCRGEVSVSQQTKSTNGSVRRDDDENVGDVGQIEHVVIVHNAARSSVASAADRVSLAAKSLCSDCDDGLKSPASPPCADPSSASPVPPPAAAAAVVIEPVADYSMFYNPRQNGVARKYWDRAKKKRATAPLKHIPPPPQDLDNEYLMNGNCHRPNTDAQLLLHCDDVTTISESRQNSERQPLLPILTPLTSLQNGDVTVNKKLQLLSMGLSRNGLIQVDSGRTVNGFDDAKMTEADAKSDDFIEQLELRIPVGKQTSSCLDSDVADSGDVPSQCERRRSCGSTEQEESHESDPLSQFVQTDVVAGSQLVDAGHHQEPIQCSAESVETPRQSMCDFNSSADIWVMQNGAKLTNGKTETSV